MSKMTNNDNYFPGGEDRGVVDEQVLNIKVDGSSAARVKVNIEGQDKIALIDRGAGRCFMNEEHYQTLGSPPLEPAEAEFRLWTASGALMPGMGFLACNMQIGGEYYRQKFIVCKQLTPGIILGRDFLSRNQLGIPEGILQLRDSQDVPVQTMEEMTTYTARLIANIVIPSRSLMTVSVRIVLPSCESKMQFDFTSIQEDTCLGPNCVIYPLDYATIKGGATEGTPSDIKFKLPRG